jgi:hypothetical protein
MSLTVDKWQTRRILILGTTYPSHSTKYVETVCTGGVFEDTKEMCRLYPIPRRYLEPGQRFHKFQFISARVTPDTKDPRPESYRIDVDSIQPQEQIDSKKHGVRRDFLEQSPNFCKSVEELLDRQKADGTSLGIVVPESITNCTVARRPESERSEWAAHEQARQSQERLFGSKPKTLDFPEALFYVHWQCNDDRCEKPHRMSLHEWGIHELYRKLEDDPKRDEKVVQAMRKHLDEGERDVFLFLGNFRSKLYNFGLMDSYSAPTRPKAPAFSLFT